MLVAGAFENSVYQQTVGCFLSCVYTGSLNRQLRTNNKRGCCYTDTLRSARSIQTSDKNANF